MLEKWGLVALAAFAMVALFLFNWNFQRNFEERIIRDQLLRAANAASDAATEYMLWNSEETPTGLIIIDPDWVWYVYKFTFLESIGLNSRANINELEHFFPAVIIAVNDGYFMRGATLNPNGQWEYRFGHKIPFARMPALPTQTWGVVPDRGFNTVNPIIPASNPGFPVIVADTMNGRNINVFYPNWDNSADADHFGANNGRYIRYAVDGRALDSFEGTAHHQPSIARELLRAMDASMRWNASPNSAYRQGGELRIPAEIVNNFNSENVTFVGPMVIALADNFTWVGNKAMSFWTLSNTQIVAAPRVYVYRVAIPGVPGGALLYSYCDPYGRDIFNQDMNPRIDGRPFILHNGSRIVQIFNSEHSAAIFGAYPDMAYAHLCS